MGGPAAVVGSLMLPRLEPRWRKWALICAWSVVLLEIAAWMAMRLGDAMVIPTLLAYGARWVWLLPVAALLPLLYWTRSVLAPSAVALAICLLGVMQFRLPHLPVAQGCCRVTVLTVNGNQAARGNDFRQLVASAGADVIAMQEWDESALDRGIAGWTIHCEGQLCIGSHHPMTGIQVLDQRTPDRSRAMALVAQVATPDGPVSFFAVHLETVRKGIEPVLHEGVAGTGDLMANLAFRDSESREVATWIRKHTLHPMLIAGDFNLPTDSAIFRQHWTTWPDAFESVGVGLGHTKFTSLWGIRIDHVLFDSSWQAVSSRVGPDVGSDHRPLIVTLQRPATAARSN
jgi:vancomycin resistance protein VanJ